MLYCLFYCKFFITLQLTLTAFELSLCNFLCKMFSSRSRTDHVEHNLSILSIIICHSALSRNRFTCTIYSNLNCCIFKIYLHDFPQLKSLSTLSQRLSYYTFKVF